MSTNLRTAAQHALEALEEATNYTGCEAWSPSMTDECLAVAVALKAALEQPEQEPVAWQWLNTAHFRKKLPADAEPRAWNPLYTHPPRREWRGLTDEEIESIWEADTTSAEDCQSLYYAKVIARSIEAAIKERNT